MRPRRRGRAPPAPRPPGRGAPRRGGRESAAPGPPRRPRARSAGGGRGPGPRRRARGSGARRPTRSRRRPPASRGPPPAGAGPASTRSSVVLPQPLGPWIVVTSPARRSSQASRSTGRPGWPARSPSSRARGGPGARAGSGAAPGSWASSASPSRPPRTATIRSATARVRSARCSLITTAAPPSRASARSVAISAAAAASSSWEVGSSSSTSRGPGASTDARATRWRSPPDSDAMARPRRCSAPAISSAVSTRAGIAAGSSPAFSRPNATSRSTDAEHRLALGILEDHPRQPADARGVGVHGVVPGDGHRSGEPPAVEVGHQAAERTQQRRLPLARGTLEQQHLAARRHRGRCRRAPGPGRRRR